MLVLHEETYIANAVPRWVRKVKTEEPEPRVCDWVRWDAGSGGVVAVCAPGWKEVPAAKHDYLPGVLPDRGDAGRARANASKADLKAGVAGTGAHERWGTVSVACVAARGAGAS